MGEYPHVRVTGSAEQRGRQYGEQARDRVHRSVSAYRDVFAAMVGWDWPTVRKEAARFEAPIARSCWVAVRIMPSGHTYPVCVQVDGKPIRASRRSAQWCRACVDKVWEVKSPFMRESERAAAADAFEHARRAYDNIIGECDA